MSPFELKKADIFKSISAKLSPFSGEHYLTRQRLSWKAILRNPGGSNTSTQLPEALVLFVEMKAQKASYPARLRHYAKVIAESIDMFWKYLKVDWSKRL